LEQFERLAADMGKTGTRRLNLSILKAWSQIWAKLSPEGLIWAVCGPCYGYGQNWPQKPQFEHFDGLAADIGKTVLSIL